MRKISENEEIKLYKEMFETVPWKLYMERMENTRDLLLEVLQSYASTNDDLRFAQGRLFETNLLLNWEKSIELADKLEEESKTVEEED